VARRLLAAVRSEDTVARLGGDEFVALLGDQDSEADCVAALQRFLRTLAAPYFVDGGEIADISASIGVTLYPRDAAEPVALLRHADQAMYGAKQAGKNRFQLFDLRQDERAQVRYQALRRIEAALREGQFALHYQPIVDCALGAIVGVEALFRWEHPDRGRLPAIEILPLVEDEALALDIGDWVIREAVAQMSAWRDDGLDLAISINTFPRQLQDGGFADKLEAAFAQTPGARPDRLQIEIVETSALREVHAIEPVLARCRQFGVQFALDDFGTGYSSLAYLRRLPVAALKIDGAIVGRMLQDAGEFAVAAAIVGLGRAFHQSVIAKGVETLEQVRALRAMGCDVMQGHAFARPMPPAELAAFARAFRFDPAWGRAAVSDQPHGSR
jgi:predicted signal transduction protein with EAL and GGDEF domain